MNKLDEVVESKQTFNGQTNGFLLAENSSPDVQQKVAL